MSEYTVRAVDGANRHIAKTINALHAIVLPGEFKIDPAKGRWWLAYCGDKPVGFGGLSSPSFMRGYGYLERAGVLPDHQGHGLHRRLIRAREVCARHQDWRGLVTDTARNPPSANNLIRLGYSLFEPRRPWGLRSSIYWRKDF